jgi:hypothetical protein
LFSFFFPFLPFIHPYIWDFFFLFDCFVLFYLSFSCSYFLFLHHPFLPSFFTLLFIFSISLLLLFALLYYFYFSSFVCAYVFISVSWLLLHNRQQTWGVCVFHATVTSSEHGRSVNFHMPKHKTGEYLLLKM